MTPRVKLLSTIAGAALLVSVLLIALSQIRRASAPAPQQMEETASHSGRLTGTGQWRRAKRPRLSS